MRNDQEELVSDLLRRWHIRAVSTPPTTGYYTSNPACKLYRVSRQHDDMNGALDTDQDGQILEAVGYAIDQMEQPYKTAVEFNARNLATGAAVWRSPRLPTDDLERAQLVVVARGKLLVLLRSAGVA